MELINSDKVPVIVRGENLTKMPTAKLKEELFYRFACNPFQWNGAFPMQPEVAAKAMEEVAKGGRQALIKAIEGDEEISKFFGRK